MTNHIPTQDTGTGRTVAIYCRAGKEAEEAGSVREQEALCRRCHAQRFEASAAPLEVFADDGFSGSTPTRQLGGPTDQCRPGLSDLMQGILDGRIGTVITTGVDRLARSHRLWSRMAAEVFLPHGVDLMIARSWSDGELVVEHHTGREVATYAALAEAMMRMVRECATSGDCADGCPMKWPAAPAARQ